MNQGSFAALCVIYYIYWHIKILGMSGNKVYVFITLEKTRKIEKKLSLAVTILKFFWFLKTTKGYTYTGSLRECGCGRECTIPIFR